MTAKRADLGDLPAWPRGLSRDQAAAYVGVSQTTFDEEVKAGLWPKGEKRGKRVIWDRAAIDRAYDARTLGSKVPASGMTMEEATASWGRRSR